VSDISNSFRAGKDELELEIRESAEPLGLTLGDLARQVRQGFYGAEAQRVQRGRDDIKVMVRYPADERRSIGNLEQMHVRTAGGDEVPFATVATVRLARGAAAITRVDRKRAISVTAEIDETTQDANTILADLEAEFLPQLRADFDGVTYSFEGEQQQQQDTLSGLGSGSIFALLLIFGLMAIPFRSYLQPLIVMSVIPFGLVGAVVGHIIMGMELSVLSLCGIVALAGVVVNDSLVLVDFINRTRERGGDVLAAVREAGVARFRPILLTSLTTFAGLVPLLLEESVQAKFLVPMAVSLAFGVLFATLITLILIPVVYLILEDVRRFWTWLWTTDPTADAA
jgi:multidrug efflux pump subunit AcrB